MAARTKRTKRPLIVKASELAIAAPQVVAHRVARMALASPVLSARDRREFTRMGAEKVEAFAESWQSMAAHLVRANQSLGAAWLQLLAWPPRRGGATSTAAARRAHASLFDLFGKGLAPIHRRAVANARRLSRTKLR